MYFGAISCDKGNASYGPQSRPGVATYGYVDLVEALGDDLLVPRHGLSRVVRLHDRSRGLGVRPEPEVRGVLRTRTPLAAEIQGGGARRGAAAL